MELDEARVILERVRAATPGPWEHHYHDATSIDDLAAFFRKALSFAPGTLRIELVTTGGPDDDGICSPDVVTVAITGNGPLSVANSEFIANAREDVPLLLAENERLRTELAQIYAVSREYAMYDVFRGFDKMQAMAKAALGANNV